MNVRQWLYKDGRPNLLARIANRVTAAQFSAAFLAQPHWVTLEVPGRRSGRTVSLPLVVTTYEDQRFLVSMLGPKANWVANVRAAHGAAVLRHGDAETVRLIEVDPVVRAPILRAYLAVAPGARAHFPIDRDAPLPEFERIAANYPVFRIA